MCLCISLFREEREGKREREVDGEAKGQRTALGVSHCLPHTLHQAGPFVDHCYVLRVSWSAGFWVGTSHLTLETTWLQTHTDGHLSVLSGDLNSGLCRKLPYPLSIFWALNISFVSISLSTIRMQTCRKPDLYPICPFHCCLMFSLEPLAGISQF